MKSKPPFFAQERPDTCALACLRMVLAAFGKETTEEQLVRAANMETGGVDIENLERLARAYGLDPELAQLELDDLAALTEEGGLCIAFLNRLSLDGELAVHAVVPVSVSPRFVTFLDPLRGQRRVSKQKFQAAQRWLANWAVVCKMSSGTN
jgi:ABC-type bacteriocin/lantibiotic exporter with double-glycine peptidase domain